MSQTYPIEIAGCPLFPLREISIVSYFFTLLTILVNRVKIWFTDF